MKNDYQFIISSNVISLSTTLPLPSSLPIPLPLPSPSSSTSTSTPNKSTSNEYKQYPFWLGGMAASMAAICTHPLDVAKVRMQTGPSRSMIKTLFVAIKSDGIIKGAYTGLSASLLRQMTYSLTRFGIYDSIKTLISLQNSSSSSSNPAKKRISSTEMVLAASLAGAIGGFAGNPADVILVRMTGDINYPIHQRKLYRNCFDGLFRMIREEGIESLARGLGPNISRAILMNASQLATYDSFKCTLLNTRFFDEGLYLHFCASSMAGAVATTICSPFDVVKSRIMNTTSKSTTVISVIKESFKNEGIGWIFRGWTPAFIRLGPNTVLIFVGLEQLKLAWDYLHDR